MLREETAEPRQPPVQKAVCKPVIRNSALPQFNCAARSLELYSGLGSTWRYFLAVSIRGPLFKAGLLRVVSAPTKIPVCPRYFLVRIHLQPHSGFFPQAPSFQSAVPLQLNRNQNTPWSDSGATVPGIPVPIRRSLKEALRVPPACKPATKSRLVNPAVRPSFYVSAPPLWCMDALRMSGGFKGGNCWPKSN